MPDYAREKTLEVWFQDEARVGQKGTVTRIWAPQGTRPRDTPYQWSYIFGLPVSNGVSLRGWSWLM